MIPVCCYVWLLVCLGGFQGVAMWLLECLDCFQGVAMRLLVCLGDSSVLLCVVTRVFG